MRGIQLILSHHFGEASQETGYYGLPFIVQQFANVSKGTEIWMGQEPEHQGV